MLKHIPRHWLLIYAIAFFDILLHIMFHGKLEYHRDELLYFTLGMHPALGYETVPPMIGWIAAAMQGVFGYSVFAVKLFPALLSGVYIILGAGIAKELGGKGYAQILATVAIFIIPPNFRAFHLFQPVPIDMVFWALSYYVLLRYLNTSRNGYLLVLGVVLGVALLTKYLIGLWILGVAAGFLLSARRDVFKNPALYKGAGLCLFVFLPNIIWQIIHGLPVIGHMQALNEDQFAYVERSAFLTDQITMAMLSFPIWLAGLVFLFREKRYRVLAISAVFVIGFLFLVKAKSYYSLGIFALLIAAGSVWVESIIKAQWLRIVIPILLILSAIPLVPFGIPVYEQDGMVAYFKDLEDDFGLILGRKFEDGTIHSLPQDYADQLGWAELAAITAKAYEKVPDKSKAIIYGQNYGQAGAIAVIGKEYGLPEPISFHESFQYWIPQQFDPDIEYFIYINDEFGDDVDALFEQKEKIGEISNPHAREYGTTVYLCSKPNRSFNTFWAEILAR